MFLDTTYRRNRALVDFAVMEHQAGNIMPDSFIIDVDAFIRNAELILEEARKNSITLYFMLKQIGRNPYLARRLQELGYAGAVAVDFKETALYMENNIRLGNVGHLVQLPSCLVEKVVEYGADNITVYSKEKLVEIDRAAGRLGRKQGVLIRVVGDGDLIYSGQTTGFELSRLPSLVREIREELPNIRINGVTSFPCFLYDEEKEDIEPTGNLKTVLKAKEILQQKGYENLIINTPSTTSVRTISKMAEFGGNSGEPGHGLSGTTPLHVVKDQPEIPAVVYLTEVSHNFNGRASVFGGGHYRRSHVRNALVGRAAASLKKVGVIPPSDESIDYHFELTSEAEVGASVIMAYRFQIFVTRADVVLVEGLSKGEGRIIGVYDSLGRIKG